MAAKTRYHRRDRRKAKASGFSRLGRQSMGAGHGHGARIGSMRMAIGGYRPKYRPKLLRKALAQAKMKPPPVLTASLAESVSREELAAMWAVVGVSAIERAEPGAMAINEGR